MASLTKVLRDEIVRVAKRGLKPVTSKMRANQAVMRRQVRALKQRVIVLERELRRAGVARPGKEAAVSEDLLAKARPTAKMIRQLRRKLDLSQQAMAKLLGVSTLTVFHWEHKEGRLTLRSRTKKALLALRGKGKREVQRELAN